jgi:hypothetical protein
LKTIQNIVTFLFIGFIVASCEGPKNFSVTVVDKVTQHPIDSVLVKVIVKAGDQEKTAYNLQGYTDSTGKFERTEMIGYGLSLKRWDFYMEYDKKGYAFKQEKNHLEGKVELEH